LEKLYTDLSLKKANLILLILASQNIKAQAQKNNGLFDILVAQRDIEISHASVETCFMENRIHRNADTMIRLPASSFRSVPCFIIMGIMILVHIFSILFNFHEAMITTYGISWLHLVQGQTYRAVTALFIHLDARHVAGNLAGLLIFAAPVISASGFGTGPFILLFAGTAGNLLNASLFHTAGLSIGASTSIMAAAGLLAVFQAIRSSRALHRDTLMPILAGAVLTALLSQGENTDITAHILGFVCGIVSGIFFFPLNRTLEFRYKEPAALIMSLAATICAFMAPWYG